MQNLNEWLAYIDSAHSQAIDMGLDRVVKVYRRLSLDFSSTCMVTVAGTNGKGTTCRFIEQACLQVPFRVGVYASPHIEQFNERIRVDGHDADDAMLCAAFAKVQAAASGLATQTLLTDNTPSHASAVAVDAISLSYFEYATLAALVIFAESKLDVCVLEVGLGGRLDATNIIDAHIGVITSIGIDHQAYLGNTTEAIAGEKAGIIKPLQSVVIGYTEMQASVAEVLSAFSNTALLCGEAFGLYPRLAGRGALSSGCNSPVSDCSGWINIDNKRLDIALNNAKIPPQNIMTALATLHLISRYFARAEPLLLTYTTLQALIAKVSVRGRFEVLSESPRIILDVAHNEDSAKYLVQRMQQMHFGHCHLVIGMLKDKNIEATIAHLSVLTPTWYCVDLPTERGEKGERLLTAVHSHQQEGRKFDSAANGLKQAVDAASEDDVILIVGSFILASQCMQVMTQHVREAYIL